MKSLVISLTKYWLPVVAWGLVIFLFSANPTASTSQIHWQDFIVKKTAHIVEYAIFFTLLYRAFLNSGFPKSRSSFLALAIAIAYAMSDEFHQSFTPGREPTIRDVIFDTIGACLANYTIWKLLPMAPKTLKTWAKKLELL